MDVIDIPLLAARPKAYQQENWLLDPQHYWVKVGCVTWNDLPQLAESPAPLWVNGHHTYNGHNDKIPLGIAHELLTSLALLKVDRLRLSVFPPSEAFGNPKRRVQGQFVHADSAYRLWVTDPEYERRFLGQPDGGYELGESYLTVSLGEPYEGCCYKLVAAIIERAMVLPGDAA